MIDIDTMNTVTPPEIPESHVIFAKAVADAATANGIDDFTLTYSPRRHGVSEMDRSFRGTLKITFSQSDGRGRPCRNLAIEMESTLRLKIESNPPSHD